MSKKQTAAKKDGAPAPKREKVVLAYSGGVDTSVAIRWLIDEKNLDVIAVCIDVGQGKELGPIRKKAEKIGAIKSVVVDAKDMFCDDYLVPAIRANAKYEGKYVHSTSLNRYLISDILVDVARKENAKWIAHGATAKGNDQVRFEVSIGALDPSLKIIGVAREWGMTRDEEFDYAKKHDIPLPVTKDSPYSLDLSIWGKSTECGVLEDPWVEPPKDAHIWVKHIEDTPDKPTYVELEFVKGVPVALNGKSMKLFDLISKLNDVAAKNGVGLTDMVESRLVGIKSRETYEAPAATVILKAHQDLETLVMNRDTLHYKVLVEKRYSELIYDGLWFSDLREHLDAFFESTQKHVSGTVRVKLFKGNCVVVGRKSPHSLYQKNLATYDTGDTFDHSVATGFMACWGLPAKVEALCGRNKGNVCSMPSAAKSAKKKK
ncbi:MAG: Argininosuccinate synthase [bacterium ADurb.Bin236]|nr:MAG: Argininosuccinate synthase [bacterium ADurb.Bin236]HOY63818.1 argininosuccinate synthase [bacterium]HPN94921.1 argininosuccinate synthase [bacterium]